MSDLITNAINHLAKEDFVVFAGTGVLSGTNSASWIELLKKLEESCGDDVEKKDWINIEDDQLPDIAQVYFETLNALGLSSKYNQVIQESIRTKDTSVSGPQFQIVLTTGKIVTTNFDDSFEFAFRDMKNTRKVPFIQELPNFHERQFAEQESIIYLHGKTDTNNFILRKDDYELFYPSVSSSKMNNGVSVLERFVHYLFFNHTIVFIGFSFRDKYVKELLRMIFCKKREDDERLLALGKGSIKNTKTIQHYAFLPNYNSEKRKKELQKVSDKDIIKIEKRIDDEKQWDEKLEADLKEINITCLRYDEHKEWDNWFRAIRDIQDTERRSKSPKSTKDYDEY